MGFCNLSEVVVRPDMNEKELYRRVEIATIIGTVQSKCTHFPYLRKGWQRNAEEERLLGVSLTGIQDNRQLALDPFVLNRAREISKETNELWAEALDINISHAVTTVKPSGTVSCLVDSASGIHHRYAPYYIRRVRCDKKDPLYKLMKDQGVPGEDCVNNPNNTYVFEFVIGYSGRNTRDTAYGMLTDWSTVKQYWTDHNPSVTIEYQPHEFMELGSRLYKDYWSIAQGLSFLPRSEHVYKQAPYEEITKEEYEQRVAAFPEIDWMKLSEYEKEDTTKSSQTFACSGNSCEIVDVEGEQP